MNKQLNINNEEWKTIKDFPKYQVSNYGRVKGPFGIRKLDNSGNYLRVNLSKDGKTTKESIHRLVAKAFIPNPNDYPVVNHIDGNKENNRADNLEWCTHKQNVQHAIYTGLRKGLTETQKQEIRDRYKNGWTLKQLSKYYGVSNSSITDWVKDIHKYKYLTQEQRLKIRKLYNTGKYSMRKLAKMFKVTHNTISAIIKTRAA